MRKKKIDKNFDCDRSNCEGKVTRDIKSRIYDYKGNIITYSYLLCSQCNMEYDVGFDNDITDGLKQKIKRYTDMKLDKDIIDNFRDKHKEESLYLKDIMMSNEEFVNNTNRYKGV